MPNSQAALEKCVLEAYKEVHHRSLSIGEVKDFIEGVVSYDGLYEAFLTNPSSVARDIFSSPITGNVVVPCYTVELRQILKDRTLVSNYPVVGMSFESARKFLSDYPVLLVIDARKIDTEQLSKLNGAYLLGSSFHFGETLFRVLVRDRGDSDTMAAVSRIVRDIAPGIDVGVVTDAPGIAPKVAQIAPQHPQTQQLNKFVVNVPTLGIEQEVVKSTSDVAALQEALDRKWKRSGNPHKDPTYTADYWLNSPMIQDRTQIVREADTATYIIKEAFQKAAVKLKLPLQIEPDEQEIFDLLLQVNQQFGLGLTFRVAGGWVRDRLLGVKSKDIDIALDKMTGAQFCDYITKATGKRANIIEADEAKSKSLETATINLGSANIPIDFVNLRKEVYEPGSRVPKMTFGTAEEDAVRRDFTLNALFYNVNAGKVEDFSGKGIEDLQNLTLRTPLDPKQTFSDDPLRVFRALRFFAKFKGAQFAPETLEAIHDPEVQEALDPKNTIDVEVKDPKTGKTRIEKQRKISEERILVEWQKLFKGPQASDALRVAYDSGLWSKVFVAGAKDFDMSKWHPFNMDQNNAWHVDNVFEHTLKVMAGYDEILEADGADDDERARAKAAAFLHDIGKLDPSIIGQKEVEGIIRNTYHGHEDSSAKAAEAILRGIKSSNEEIEYIKTIVQNHMIPHNKMTDKQINKMIRNLGRTLVKRIVQHAKADAMSKPGADVQHYDDLVGRVNNAFAVEPHQVKPVIDGGRLIALFPTLQPKSGFIKEIQDRLQDMKDGYPQLAEQEALVEVENMRAEIMSKYQNFVPQKKVPQQKPPKAVTPAPMTPHPGVGHRVAPPTTPPTQAAVKPFNLAKESAAADDASMDRIIDTLEKVAGNGSIEMLCGKVLRHKFGKAQGDTVFIFTDSGEEYKLRRSQAEDPFEDPELDNLVGKRICGKGMIHDRLFIVSEYSIVNLDKDGDIVDMKRKVPDDMVSFNVGDKVRHRQRGLAFQQIEGKVDKIEHGLMYVKWDGVKELEVFSLSDPVALFGILQKT